jgi:hypothetical protein
MVFFRHIAKVVFWTLAIVGGGLMICTVGVELYILAGNLIYFWRNP